MALPELASREVYKLADLTVDVGAARCQRGRESVDLPALSFDLLVCLIRRAPNVVSVNELVDTVWHVPAVSDETVVQRVALLRKALGDKGSDPRYIRSVRGKGYQIIPEIGSDEGRFRTEATPRGSDRLWFLVGA